MPAPMTRAEREEFLAGVHVGILSAVEPGRGPLSVPVWYLYEVGGEIVVVTRPEARKARLLGVGAPVSFCVQSEEIPPKYVTIQGRVVSAAPADVARDLKPIRGRLVMVIGPYNRLIPVTCSFTNATLTPVDSVCQTVTGSIVLY